MCLSQAKTKHLGELSYLFKIFSCLQNNAVAILNSQVPASLNDICVCVVVGGGWRRGLWIGNKVPTPGQSRQNPVCSPLHSFQSPLLHSMLTGSPPATLGFLLPLKHAAFFPSQGPLNLLFALPGALFPQIFIWLAFWVISGLSCNVRGLS